MTEHKRKFIIFACVFAVAAALFVLSAIFTAPKSEETSIVYSADVSAIETADGAEVYYATENGVVLKSGEGGYESRISDRKIGFLANTEAGLVAVDENNTLFVLDPSGDVIRSKQLPGLFVNVAYGDEKFYVAMTTNYSNLYIYRYDYELTEEKNGRLYLYNPDSDRMEAASLSVYAFYERDRMLYIFNDVGQAITVPTSLDSLTNNKESYFGSGAQVTSFERPIKAVFADDESRVFYVACKDGAIYRYGYGTNEITGPHVTFSDDIAMITYSPVDSRLYVFFDLYDKVTAVNVNSWKKERTFGGVFNLMNAEVSADGSNLYTLYKDGGSAEMKRFGVAAAMKNTALMSVLRTAFIILAVICALLCVISLILLFKARKFVAHGKISIKRLAGAVFKHKFIYLVLAPSIILLFMFCYYPSIKSLIMAFFDYRSGYPVIFTGFDNFRTLFANPVIGDAIRNMLIFLASDLILGIIPPIIFAWSLSVLGSKKFSSLARILLFIPGIIPGVAGMLIWKEGFYGQYGLFNTIVKAFGGTPVAFLGDKSWSMASLIFMGFPFVGSYLIFYGAIANIPQAYYDAAEMEGIGVLRRIVSIDLPFITPQIKYVFVMSFIGSVQNVSRVMLTTQGAAGTQIPIYLMYNYLSDNNFGVASAMALLLFAVLTVATVINLKMKTVDTDV